jgi:alkanesulfonate monooxygenase SsuD/methylene tetrahydromethanopterin reductase-like flavin-dependent oxidoreductase (luciferase family)
VKFDLFYQLPCADSQNPAERYRELIDEAVEADKLGFDTVWLAEIHFAPHFSIMPTPMMILAAIAARTPRIRLGLAVNLIPLHHPIRLAEETAALDLLSGGRVEFGAGRGAFPLNYRGYQVDLQSSRERFEEGLEFVKQAWTQGRVSFRGKFLTAHEINVVPKPIQRPHPPIRIAANSADTFRFAGTNGYPIFSGGPVNPIPVLADRLVLYKRACSDAGRALPKDWLAAMWFVFVGRDRASVRAAIEPSLRNYFDSVLEIIEPQTLAPEHAHEFERVRERLRKIDYETVDSLMGIFGDPEYCADRIAEMRERFGFTRLVSWFEAGGLTGHDNVLASMRLFAERVMPRFRGA